MKVFLSWSGKVSHDVASALHQWLPYMHHAIKPFMSSLDISKGERWGEELSRELKDTQYAIICVTPFNTLKPWMNFEAGALNRLPRLTPFLFRVDRALLGHSPLTQFQLTEYSRDQDRSKHEFLDLLQSINNELPEAERLDEEVLQKNFDHWWTELKTDLDAISESSPGETRTAYKWLRTFDDLAVHDLRPDGDTVWFVTDDIFKYALRAGLREKIEANLDKVRYRYLIPDPDGIEERAARDQLDRLAARYPTRLEYRSFDPEVFRKQATSDYVIIESKTADTAAKIFVRIPIADVGEDYWFDTEERAAHGFYLRFVQLWNSPAVRGATPTALPAAPPTVPNVAGAGT
jgi:TIR domain